jgi:hypothetical protein
MLRIRLLTSDNPVLTLHIPIASLYVDPESPQAIPTLPNVFRSVISKQDAHLLFALQDARYG